MSVPAYGWLCHDGECLGMVEDRGTPIREFFRYHGKIYHVEITYAPTSQVANHYQQDCLYTVHEMAITPTNHDQNPTSPIKLDNNVFCGCTDCTNTRNTKTIMNQPEK